MDLNERKRKDAIKNILISLNYTLGALFIYYKITSNNYFLGTVLA